MPTQHQANLDFLSYKEFDVTTLSGLKAALKWLKTLMLMNCSMENQLEIRLTELPGR